MVKAHLCLMKINNHGKISYSKHLLPIVLDDHRKHTFRQFYLALYDLLYYHCSAGRKLENFRLTMASSHSQMFIWLQGFELALGWQLIVHLYPAFLHPHWWLRHPVLHWHAMRERYASGIASFVIHRGVILLFCSFHPMVVGSGMMGFGMCARFQMRVW